MNIPFRMPTLVAALSLAGATLLTAAHAQVKIAMVIPTTGPLTQYGDMVKEGVETAVEEINGAGGIGGKKIEIVAIDDACEPKQGPVAANRVVNAKIGYVVGPVCSGASIAAAPIYNNEGVVVITPSATSPALTEGKNYTYIFRTIGRDDQQGPFAAKFIAEKVKPKKVAVLHDKQSYGQGIAAAVRDTLKASNVNVALFELPADFASNPKNAAVVKAFKDKKRDPSGSFQMASYTAVKVIAESIKAVGDNADKVAKHLHTASFDTPLGTLAWDAKGDLKSYDFQVFQWHKDGSKTAAAK
jgi:ABC-type branched-subunit amino acid transport system substrate-binding protein